MYIELFIASDGEFRHVTPETRHWRERIEPVINLRQLMGSGELRSETAVIETKVFRRFRLMIPSTELGEGLIPTWPSGAWDNFLRHMITDLEAKGDAPWK